jgi:hypothetical protein
MESTDNLTIKKRQVSCQNTDSKSIDTGYTYPKIPKNSNPLKRSQWIDTI